MRLKCRILAATALLACAACMSSNVVPSHNPNVFLFHTITTIGLVVDPTNGDQNPYGLSIAPLTAGLLTAGDLLICNFNDAANVQGNGTTLETIHPTPGSTVRRFAQTPLQMGCGAVAALSNGSVAVTAKLANDVPIYNASGTLTTTLSSNPWQGPWGIAFSPTTTPALYVTNANDGSIFRVRIISGGTFAFDRIATGFSVNGGVPGSIFAPYGLSYSGPNDTLYIIDTNANRIVAFSNVSTVPVGGITVTGGTFSGPAAFNARVLASGAPLNNPLGSTVLPNGNLGVVNSSDNLFMEFEPAGMLVGSLVLDPAPGGGALFSIASTTNAQAQTIVYFVDDDDNTVKILSP